MHLDKLTNPDKPTEYVYPQIPKTGDNSHMNMYVGLMILSGMILIILAIESWRKKNGKRW